MSLNPTKMFYPVESYNNRARSEERWEADARIEGNPYCDAGKWQISIKNGKRLRRHWTRNGGLATVPTKYGDYSSIYNKEYDVYREHWHNHDLAPPKGLTRQVAMSYDTFLLPFDDGEHK
tara:strand:- start:49 stop:408 length:360 start_codon:yes stop_codon:yes gene_type:complete